MFNDLKELADLFSRIGSGNNASFKNTYRVLGTPFDHFSCCAILYALVEYAKYDRSTMTTHRLEYLYNKCCEYIGCVPKNVGVLEEFGEERIFYVEDDTDDLLFS